MQRNKESWSLSCWNWESWISCVIGEESATMLLEVSSGDLANKSRKRESKSSSPMGGTDVMTSLGGELTRASSTTEGTIGGSKVREIWPSWIGSLGPKEKFIVGGLGGKDSSKPMSSTSEIFSKVTSIVIYGVTAREIFEGTLAETSFIVEDTSFSSSVRSKNSPRSMSTKEENWQVFLVAIVIG